MAGKCLSLCVFGANREVVIPNNVHTGGYSYVCILSPGSFALGDNFSRGGYVCLQRHR